MLPNIADTLLEWELPMIIRLVTQTLQTTIELDGSYTEDNTYIYNDYMINGVYQPLKPTEIQLKPAEQRYWNWQQVHVRNSFQIANPNDKIIINSIVYKIMLVNNYDAYGYTEYHIVNDFI